MNCSDEGEQPQGQLQQVRESTPLQPLTTSVDADIESSPLPHNPHSNGIASVATAAPSAGAATATATAAAASASRGRSKTAKLSDVQLKLEALREASRGDTLLSRYLLSNAVAPVNDPASGRHVAVQLAVDEREEAGVHIDPHQRDLYMRAALQNRASGLRFKNQQVLRRKLVLLGYQEVGKTSLKKCFESEPFFFKRLPEVKATTGVQVTEQQVSVDGEPIDLFISDFAGQEVYHSHTFFLTHRAIFLLVWKISGVEQDFQSSGINAREEQLLYKWVAEVYAKFPRARIALVATHLDELRVQGQRSVEMILKRVEEKIRAFIRKIAAEDGIHLRDTRQLELQRQQQQQQSPAAAAQGASASSSSWSYPAQELVRNALLRGQHPAGAGGRAGSVGGAGSSSNAAFLRFRLVGSFAVSCKTREVIAASPLDVLSGRKISAMLSYLAQVARDDCLDDREYPCAGIPGRHMRLLEDVQEAKRRNPNKLLLQMSSFVHMAARVGVESDAELLQVARLLHSWDVIYVLSRQRLEDNLFVLLHPRWLCDMTAALFSYAHVLRTPAHLLPFMDTLPYSVAAARKADRGLLRRGYLRLPLARVLFRRCLQTFLGRPPDDSDVTMCLQLLEAMDLVYPVRVPSGGRAVLAEESPVEPEVGVPALKDECVTRYFVPSLSPLPAPARLRVLAPVLLSRGVRVRLEFSLLPDELWWRLQARLHQHYLPIVVRQPVPPEEELSAAGLLTGSDDEHSRWTDAMWLHGPDCRALLCREGMDGISFLSGETVPGRSEALLAAVEEALSSLLAEYPGVRRATWVACPNPVCGGWIEADAVATSARVPCPVCRETFSSDDFVPCEGRYRGQPHSTTLLRETRELLALSLPGETYAEIVAFLGIGEDAEAPDKKEEKGPAAPREADAAQDGGAERSPSAPEAACYYCRALDKIVQVLLFNSCVEREEERARRQRMLEPSPSGSLFP